MCSEYKFTGKVEKYLPDTYYENGLKDTLPLQVLNKDLQQEVLMITKN